MTAGAPPEQAASDDALQQLLVLQQRANQLVRLVLRQVDSGIPKSMAGVLKLVSEGPRSITELARLDGLAQPTVTVLVNQAEARGWVRRVADRSDGRVVRVEITDAGLAARTTLHRAIVDLLRDRVTSLQPQEVERLVAAADALVPLIEALQRQDDPAEAR